MPRGRPKKQLQAIQEDEILEEAEEHEESAPVINEEQLEVIQGLEAEGDRPAACAGAVGSSQYGYIARCVDPSMLSAVQERANALLEMAEAECRSILHDFTMQLMKLSKQVFCASCTAHPKICAGPMSLSSSPALHLSRPHQCQKLHGCLLFKNKREMVCIQVREVPLGEFRTKFSGDVNAVLMDSINQRLLAARVSLILYVHLVLDHVAKHAVPGEGH